MSDQKLLTAKEVASWLRLSLAEVYRLIGRGELTHYRVGPAKGAIRVSSDDVESFLTRRRSAPAEKPAKAERQPPLKHLKRKTG
ncbi:helix-turn-helix domain-containing protein [Rhodopirellula europaea]|uniref:helix-turn-helix domain-containing protein n=1 Tax=Rhodopirellula europaea TaxID=1263866 RepID=UPI003C6E930D|tara:strand:- start:328 stop:579 length:252 start_codon:yes stop_codon:yes gene_type:complete